MMFAAELSVVFIYLLMGFLFESFILPLSIICTIPLAGIGVVWIHYLTGQGHGFPGRGRRHPAHRRGGEQRHRAD